MVALICAAAASLLIAAPASAGVNGECPPIADKPGAIPHANYAGMQQITYCVPATVDPGQNIIRLAGTNLKPNVPGYITRFDPELVYADGSIPPVDVLHLHHAVWVVNGGPQFAAGEEKTIAQLPQGFGWRHLPTHGWLLNDMIHDLIAKPANIYIVWRIDFVPDTSPAAASIKPVSTRWMDVAGTKLYPVFDALREMDPGGQYTFPDEATGEAREDIGGAHTWTAPGPRTLIGTAGHLHPGGLNVELRVTRGNQTRTLFTSRAHYYEPAGAVSWDVSMGATPGGFWRVKVQTGDRITVHTTYDTKRADWYEGMGIMPISVYNGSDVGGMDALDPNIPQVEILTHGHLRENDNHGGEPTGAPNPLQVPGVPVASNQVDIKGFNYVANFGELGAAGFNRNPPTIMTGESLSFKNLDANYEDNAFHTITNCAPPCNGRTGIAYPLADGPVSFDSGQLGFNQKGVGEVAKDEDTWELPKDMDPGTYAYFCRVHPFMRGSFRVTAANTCHGKKATLIGTEGRDVIKGTKKRDVIIGLGGNDKIIGLGGNDQICGGEGKDRLIGGKGKDKMFGDSAKDKLLGGLGVDRLYGGTARDMLKGGPAKDKLTGGAGNDREKQ